MTVPSFRDFLTEASDTKLLHLQHLEDLMLDDGVSGFLFAQAVLHEFERMFRTGGVSRALNVTTKWDGAPSVVFGPDPADGQFFVATKSAFSKTPKLMKTHEQIHAEYGDSQLANKLHTCLTELKLLRPTVVLQGDLLFTDDTSTQVMDGRSYITFRPNTILYAVDAASDIGQRVQRAALGIAVHTMYTGSGREFASYRKAVVTPSVLAPLMASRRVLVVDSTFDDVSGTVTFTDGEAADFALLMARIKQTSNRVPPAIFEAFAQEPLHQYVQMFINAQVRTGSMTRGSAMVDALLEFIEMRKQKKTSELKNKEAIARTHQLFAAITAPILKNTAGCAAWFDLHSAVMSAKNMIVQKLAQGSRIGTFLPTPNGLKVTGHEGYVAVSHSGKMIKLVDRLEFSRANFLAPKAWA